MQEMTSAPQMASPYTPVGGSNMPTTMPQPPKLGTPIPGTTGGLPAKPGLSVFDNPLSQPLQSQPQQTNNPQAQQAAQHARSYGRGEDSVLIHMTPDEVNSLRGLAQQFGGDLSVNPNTGLPEAGWLGKLLPTILGVAGAAFGIPTWAIGLGVGAGQTALTGDLSKGLTAGLQAFGGAGMANAAGLGGELSKTGLGLFGEKAASSAAPAIGKAAEGTLESAFDQTFGAKAPGFLGKFAQETAIPGIGKMGATLGPALAGSAVLGGVSDAFQPELKKYNPDEQDGYKMKYEGPYRYPQRRIDPTVTGEGEISFFDNTNPVGYLNAAGEMRGYAEGGEAKKEERPSWMQDWMSDLSAAELVKDPRYQAFGAQQDKLAQEYFGLIKQLGDKWTGTIAKGRDPLQDRIYDINQQMIAAIPAQQYLQNRVSSQRDVVNTPAAAPTGGLGATAPAATLPAVVPPVTKPEEKISVNTLGTTISPLMGGVTPGSGTGATLGDRVLSPGATQSGAGLEVLKDSYTPKFSEKPDYVTPASAPYTLGSQMAAALPALTSRYSTSPGAITASSGYTGGSPSERIRAAAQARAAAKAAAGAIPTNPASSVTNPLGGFVYGDTPTAGSEINFGLGSSAGDYGTGVVNPFAIGSDEFWDYVQGRTGGGSPRMNDAVNIQRVARGGKVDMRDGAFVVDARTVSELGNGSSNAGIELLQRLGGQPVRGPGDGVSDSVPASIGGKQEARVARDEVIFQPEAVKRLGGGDEKRGTQKLYAMMKKAHKARKRAGRGSDTNLRRGLA